MEYEVKLTVYNTLGMNLQQKIRHTTSEYFEDTIHPLKLSQATSVYKSILNSICGEALSAEEGREDLLLDNGKPLGTLMASYCLDDVLRTRQFIHGINDAIIDKSKTQNSIHIMYAGTGPFATLLLPIILKPYTVDIKYTFLEINSFSFKLLKRVLSKLELEAHDITLVNEDATTYQIDSKNEPDIIVSEAMQNALAKEQQVPIYLNLIRQVKYDALFIPEKIELYIGLTQTGIPMEALQLKHYHQKTKVFEVSKTALFGSHESKTQSYAVKSFPINKTVIAPEILKGYDYLVLITKIQIYKKIKIGINDSALTTPIFVSGIPRNLQGSITFNTQYKISSEPKLEYSIHLPGVV
ncbi:hypothetical protein N7U66_07905 [Lacinutrix neustonica]|uniref:PRMT5 arginine-N-methyltransferase domain-containing protein n=1 Tax=Lacinutrix neustonica TaxID=2980107 RepID=A0A9E8SFH5_9FLAO|nr:hypothetical protein [Lacinutrix neustonica]WAC03424.1 hypothetical protein N7U66_07905 [Lacinutrix neustonica]